MEKRKVAIYARVSTEHEAQISALDNQIQYYENILQQHPEWELVDTYIDEGITGTSVLKREDFLRMIEDANNGLFDLIITREVSRFARNTVDTLQETRKLKRIGVEVWFISDNIWTIKDEDGELRLTIMATLAQNESKKTSDRVKAGQMISFKNGVPYGNGNILGYDKLPNHGGYVINPEQAETVKMIYDLYLQGLGEKAISYELEKRGRITSTGKTKWQCSYIGRVLNNPFYCGTLVYRKQFVKDYLEQKKINNHGEVENIVVEGKHTPIITKQQYLEVQKIMETKRLPGNERGRKGYKRSDNIWIQKMVCECGQRFNKKISHHTKEGIPQLTFQCYTSVRNGTLETRRRKGLSLEGVCEVPMIPEWKMELQASMIFAQLFQNKNAVLEIANDLLEKNIQLENDTFDVGQQIKEVEDKKNRIKQKLDTLLDIRLAGEITKEEYAVKKRSLEKSIEEIDNKISKAKLEEGTTIEDLDERVKVLKYALEQNFNFSIHNIPRNILNTFVKKIVVHKDFFEWHLNFFEHDDVYCLVEGNKSHPKVSFADNLDMDKKPSFGDTQHRLQSQTSNCCL